MLADRSLILMDLKSLGNYYVWADKRMLTAIDELSEDEFTHKHEGLGRSVRELVEHLHVTYDFLSSTTRTQEAWNSIEENAQAMNRGELLKNWIISVKSFAEIITAESRKEIDFPVSKDRKITLDIDNYYLLYSDHQTYHRAQMNSLIKIHGKKGENTDYYSFIMRR